MTRDSSDRWSRGTATRRTATEPLPSAEIGARSYGPKTIAAVLRHSATRGSRGQLRLDRARDLVRVRPQCGELVEHLDRHGMLDPATKLRLESPAIWLLKASADLRRGTDELASVLVAESALGALPITPNEPFQEGRDISRVDGP
jgi:hypothetical protein